MSLQELCISSIANSLLASCQSDSKDALKQQNSDYLESKNVGDYLLFDIFSKVYPYLSSQSFPNYSKRRLCSYFLGYVGEKLKVIRSKCNTIVDKGCYQRLMQCCNNIEVFSVQDCKNIMDEDLKILCSNCPSMTEINLSGCENISDQALGFLVGTSNANRELMQSRFHSLGLGNLPLLSDHGVAKIAFFSKLKRLDLGGCQQITDAGVLFLTYYSQYPSSTWPGIPGLEELSLRGTAVTDAVLDGNSKAAAAPGPSGALNRRRATREHWATAAAMAAASAAGGSSEGPGIAAAWPRLLFLGLSSCPRVRLAALSSFCHEKGLVSILPESPKTLARSAIILTRSLEWMTPSRTKKYNHGQQLEQPFSSLGYTNTYQRTRHSSDTHSLAGLQLRANNQPIIDSTHNSRKNDYNLFKRRRLEEDKMCYSSIPGVEEATQQQEKISLENFEHYVAKCYLFLS